MATLPTGARDVTTMLPFGTISVEHDSIPAREICRIDRRSRSERLTSPGVTQVTSPFQYLALPLAGVEPPTIRLKACFNFVGFQCPGTCPSHGTPDSLYSG